ncbi:MAG: phosphoglycerate kinase [Candidatus Nezhaarchaeales archaeon]|nr:MAG: phosphoglycerate kinase [Candidatus Nezhaarchaeota archaeon WYZ-LMO8]TDA35555.1 MAG: phosphoglycerate kinase [Candidatus Nezhaarchaeota archaeon WYZ-LMO7]
MNFEFLTLDDVYLEDKRVLVRVDINSPIGPDGRILDENRIREASITLRELKDSKVVVMSHQGRPGKSDFVSLEKHATILEKYVGRPVRFIDDLMGPAARSEVLKLENGDILLFENTRLYSEEIIEASIEDCAKTLLVRKLSPLFDLFVNDAFPAAHRSQPSLVGFAYTLPSVAGRLVEKELKALREMTPRLKRPIVYILGGAKIGDRLEVIETLTKTGLVDKIIVGGLLAPVFLEAKGERITSNNVKKDKEFESSVERARRLLRWREEVFLIPVDVAVDRNGERVDCPVGKILGEYRIKDVGLNTVDMILNEVSKAGSIIANGPLGVFEEEQFSRATMEVLKAISRSNAISIVSGGHLTTALRKLEAEDKVTYTSTAGGALLHFLAGKRLPIIDALEIGKRNAEKLKLIKERR